MSEKKRNDLTEPIIHPNEYITAIVVYAYNTHHDAPEGFSKTHAGNLNHGVNGDGTQVRIAVKTARAANGTNVRGVTDIKICRNKEHAGYIVNSQNLNAGNNGDRLYLAYKLEKKHIGEIVKSIGTSNAGNRKDAKKNVMLYDTKYINWYRVFEFGDREGGDTNYNAGSQSDFVYVWWSKNLKPRS